MTPSERSEPERYPRVHGRCVACHGRSLFLGEGGYVTCSRLDCSDPAATDRLLHEAHIHLPPEKTNASR